MFRTPMIAPAAPPIISSSRPALPVFTKLATQRVQGQPVAAVAEEEADRQQGERGVERRGFRLQRPAEQA